MNLGDFRTLIKARLGVRTSSADFTAQIDACINQSHRKACAMVEAPYRMKEATITITSPGPSVALPSDCRRVVAVYHGGEGHVLVPTTRDVEAANHGYFGAGGHHGTPHRYEQMAGLLYLFPFPSSDGSHSVTVEYQSTIPKLTLPTDEPILPEEAQGYILEDAICSLSSNPPYASSIHAEAKDQRGEQETILYHVCRGRGKAIQTVQNIRKKF
jgi:hypothetical protein